MSKPKLFIDFDSTSVNSIKRLVEMLNIKFDKNCNWRDIKNYSASDLFPDATMDDILDCFADKEFFNGLEFHEGFLNVIKKYEYYFDYCIATIGTESNLKHKKIWCEENFNFPYTFEGIVKNGTGKEGIDMSNSIFIDDHINNLRTSNAEIKILYKDGLETDWNTIDKNSDIDLSYLQVNTWSEIDLILDAIIESIIERGRIV